MSITAIILTYNEEQHIERCIDCVRRVADSIYVVDSFSQDETCRIARENGAEVICHEYVNQAQQFQWALDNLPIQSEWVMRMDADEYLTEKLIDEIKRELPGMPSDVNGIYIPRDVVFLGRRLRFGKLKSPRIMRIWRNGTASMEQRWMDEKMFLLSGRSVCLKHKFIDHNFNNLAWWTQKHNNYSNRELAVEAARKYGIGTETNDDTKRNQRKGLYYRFPSFLRAAIYFSLRYFALGGILDGRPGLVWATLQAYWYRFLIDSKLYEMERRIGKHPAEDEVREYFKTNYNITL